MLPLTSPEHEIANRLTTDLAQVEACFAAELVSDLDCVNQLVTHVERYRGKMLRPTLLLASGYACSPSLGGQDETTDEALIVTATVMEMVHMATLVHDDVLDDAETRRHGDTVNFLCGNETAVMLGDYLISHAYHLCSSLDRPAISRAIAEATNTVCEGELLQLANRENWQLDEQTYFEIIRRKTASLCGVCCRLAGEIGGCGNEVVEAMYDFGEKIGIAFQIVDDLLDLVGSQDTVGKTLGRDLDKGKLTLPIIHYLNTHPDEVASIADSTAGNSQNGGNGRHGLADDNHESLRQRVLDSDSIHYARGVAEDLISQAKGCLALLEVSDARAYLAEMADAVVKRRY